MELISITSFLNVKRCYTCQGEVEYFCHVCQQDMCLHCMEEHVIDPDTKYHDVTIYRGKYKNIPTKEMCKTHPDRPYEMYCMVCAIPVCFHCRKHRKHKLCNLRTAYKDKLGQCKNYIMNIRSVKLFNTGSLLGKLKTDFKTQHQIVNCIESNLFEKAQNIKYLLESMTSYLYFYKDRSLKQKKKMEQCILRIESLERGIGKAANRPVKFLRLLKMSPDMKYNFPYIKLVYSLGEICEEDVVAILCKMQITKRTKNESLLQQAASPVLQKTLTASDVRRCFHISCNTRDRIWVNDWNSLILTDTTTSDGLINVSDARHIGGTGIHSVNRKCELVYIDSQFNINKFSVKRKKKETIIECENSSWEVQCLYCSCYSGHLLVGIRSLEENAYTGMIRRYTDTGFLVLAIKRDKKGGLMYSSPTHITENNNGNIVVSDPRHGVVVTDYVGEYRFSYTGNPSKSTFLPCGICTDSLSNILVCDLIKSSVHIIDMDGQFLSFLWTKEVKPFSLSYDVNTHVLSVGSLKDNKISLYTYTKRYRELSDTRLRSNLINYDSTFDISEEGNKDQRLSIHGQSLELNLINDKIQREMSKSSLFRDNFHEQIVKNFTGDIRTLSHQVTLMRTFGNRSDERRPGTVFGIEIEVKYEKNELQVKEKDVMEVQQFFHLRNYYAPKVILVHSKSISTVEAKLAVYRKYRKNISMKSTFIHHEYDDYGEVSKWIAFHKLSSFLNTVVRMTTDIKWDISEDILQNSLNREILVSKTEENRRKFLERLQEIDPETGQLVTFNKKTLKEETLTKFTLDVGNEIVKQLKGQRKLLSAPPTWFYAHIIRTAIQDHIFKGSAKAQEHFVCCIQGPALPDVENKKLPVKDVIYETLELVLLKLEDIVKSYLKMCGKTEKEFKNICAVLEDCKRLCQPPYLTELVQEWEKREIFKASGEIKRYSSVVKYILGRKNDQPSVKVFLRNDDENAKSFFIKQRNSLSQDTEIEFVLVEGNKKETWEAVMKIKRIEREAPNIPRKTRNELEEIANREGDKIYGKYSNVVGIGVSNIHIGNGNVKITPCIVLYCLDKTLVPFGETPLPTHMGKYLCDTREKIVMFGSCESCLNVNPGCDIGSHFFAGSAGFLVNSSNCPFTGFLTAAHVAVKDVSLIYEENSSSFIVNTSNQQGDIMHPSNSGNKVGVVYNCIFGNYCSNGSDVAIVRMSLDAKTTEAPEPLTIADKASLQFDGSMKVIKRGNVTGETTGVLDGPLSSIRVGFQQESIPSFIFMNCYSILDEDPEKPFFKIGDSGSGVFITNDSKQVLEPLGIAFARGGDFTTIVCKIKHITDQFKLSIYQNPANDEEPMDTT